MLHEHRHHDQPALAITNMLYIDLNTLLPDIADAQDACVRRLIGSLSIREGFEHIFAAAAAPGVSAKLCIQYKPDVLAPPQIQEIVEGLSSSLRQYICRP